jgi:hypothetical protein
MVYSLLYVSKTLLEFPAGDEEVAKIVAVSNSRNAALGVTGALLHRHVFRPVAGRRAGGS